MISHTNKCIFVHIPKVAGTSLISLLNDPKSTPKERAFFSVADKFDPPPPHLRAIDHLKYGLATQEQFDHYFKFAFVRNPWDRLVSEYKYRHHPAKVDFKTFLFNHFPKPTWSDKYCHVIPQYDFIYDTNGNCMLDFVGKFENLQEDFTQVCRRLKLPETKLVHKNKSLSLFRRDNSLYHILKAVGSALSIKHKRNTFAHYTEYYDDESVEAVGEIYQQDIDAFQYKFAG